MKADAGDLSRSVVVFTQRELVRINGVVKDLDGRRDGIAAEVDGFNAGFVQDLDDLVVVAGLLERLGMEREDVIACGDGLNDLPMLRYAGVGVAMGNAQPAVKAAADVVTLSNDEDGLVPVIERYLLGR